METAPLMETRQHVACMRIALLLTFLAGIWRYFTRENRANYRTRWQNQRPKLDRPDREAAFARQVSPLNRFVLGVALAAGSASVAAQAVVPASPQAKSRAMQLSAALGACHAGNATRFARSDPNATRVIDKVMSQCLRQENAVRAEVYRNLDAATAARVMRDQRAHWRRRVGELVARARARK